MSSLLAPDVTLRAVDPDRDRPLLLAVYASTRADELARVPWTADQKASFVEMQFDAQDTYWAQQRPGTVRSVIEVDGVGAGRLYVDRAPDEIRIVDIAVLPAHRGSGAGTALLRGILAEGDRAGVPVTIHVEKGNRARTLYTRLGFRPVSDAGAYDLWERPAAALPTPTETSA